jgi:hypothetical protein
MTQDRRYQDEEIRAIFGAAAEAREFAGRTSASANGLTLTELQQIGREVGIPAEKIAAAARALDHTQVAVIPRRTFLGVPIGVGRSVDLARAPTDREWGLLVSELRQAFGARGKVESQGDLREWWNGNLHACIEPTDTGYRLRLSTLKGTAVPTLVGGTVAVVYGLVMFTILQLTGKIPDGLAAPALPIALGALAVGFVVRQLPAWARQREEQMDHVASRAQTLIGSEPADPR